MHIDSDDVHHLLMAMTMTNIYGQAPYLAKSILVRSHGHRCWENNDAKESCSTTGAAT